MVRSAGRLLAAVITLATADWSAGRAFGAVIDHTLESFVERTVSSPARFLISSPTMFGSLKARIFVVVSGAGVLAFSSSFLLDHQRAPDSPASRTAAINNRLSFIAVPCYRRNQKSEARMFKTHNTSSTWNTHVRPPCARNTHIITPIRIITSGICSNTNQNTVDTCRAFMFKRRSVGSLGRIEMRSSSELSQL